MVTIGIEVFETGIGKEIQRFFGSRLVGVVIVIGVVACWLG